MSPAHEADGAVTGVLIVDDGLAVRKLLTAIPTGAGTSYGQIREVALPLEEAMDEIRRGAGMRYDRGVAEAFPRVPAKDWKQVRLRCFLE